MNRKQMALIGRADWWNPSPARATFDLRVNERGPPFYTLAIGPGGAVDCDPEVLQHSEFYFAREEQFDSDGYLMEVAHHFSVRLSNYNGTLTLSKGC